jgi:hypothetical protein
MGQIIYDFQNDENLVAVLDDNMILLEDGETGLSITEISIDDAKHLAKLILQKYK